MFFAFLAAAFFPFDTFALPLVAFLADFFVMAFFTEDLGVFLAFLAVDFLVANKNYRKKYYSFWKP